MADGVRMTMEDRIAHHHSQAERLLELAGGKGDASPADGLDDTEPFSLAARANAHATLAISYQLTRSGPRTFGI